MEGLCNTGCQEYCRASFSNPSAALPTSQLVLQPFRCFTCVIGTLPMSQLILQPFRRFTYVTARSTTLPLHHLRHRHFKYVTWRTAHAQGDEKTGCGGLAFYSNLGRSYNFGQLLRILLRAVNVLSYSCAVSSDSSFNIHNALYFVKYPSRAAQNSPEGRMRPAGRGLKTPAVGLSWFVMGIILPYVTTSMFELKLRACISEFLKAITYVCPIKDIFAT